MIDNKERVMEEFNPLTGQGSRAPQCTDANNNTRQRRTSSFTVEKYGLRPRSVVRRLQLDRGREGLSQRDTKSSKSRPPPLSKYRRKTANARERHRMKEINDAFETLRRILPDFCSRRAAAAMTKITTLRLAVSYIRALSHILQDGHPGDISFFDDLHFEDVPISGSQLTSISGMNGSQPQTHLVEKCLTISPLPSTSFSPISCSLSTSSDLSDLLSDDSCCVFEDNLHAFDDIPALPEAADPFSLILAPDGEALLLG
ncbi:neurogenin-2-like [Homarus americanus]|uniref:neurogenin-2-like n=1 Tax=Homarus americanus TaxID=6706 RepID=UPI001C46DCB4|nr:neurogenin-2-like [Homarus americanus]